MRCVTRFGRIAWCALLLVSACTSNGRGSGTTSTTLPSTTSPSTSAATTSPSPTSGVTTTDATATTASAPGQVPGAVSVVAAAPGGGSGEVVVDWNAVPTATGYRVARALTATSSFETVADFSVLTGRVTAAAGVVNIWSTGYSYVPASTAGSLPDRSPSFEYVEVGETGDRCFRVTAYNAAGRAPASKVVCSGPP